MWSNITKYTKAGSLTNTDDWFTYAFLPIRGNIAKTYFPLYLKSGSSPLNLRKNRVQLEVELSAPDRQLDVQENQGGGLAAYRSQLLQVS